MRSFHYRWSTSSDSIFVSKIAPENHFHRVARVHQTHVTLVRTTIHHRIVLKSVTTLLPPVPNMSKSSAAYQNKINHAVGVLLKAPGISLSEAMILAQFLKKDIANDSIRRMIQRCHKAKKDSTNVPPTNIVVSNNADVSLMTGSEGSTTTKPQPKQKRIRMTASSAATPGYKQETEYNYASSLKKRGGSIKEKGGSSAIGEYIDLPSTCNMRDKVYIINFRINIVLFSKPSSIYSLAPFPALYISISSTNTPQSPTHHPPIH